MEAMSYDEVMMATIIIFEHPILNIEFSVTGYNIFTFTEYLEIHCTVYFWSCLSMMSSD